MQNGDLSGNQKYVKKSPLPGKVIYLNPDILCPSIDGLFLLFIDYFILILKNKEITSD